MSRRVLLIAVLFTAIADPALANWWIVRASDGKCIVVDIEPTGKDKTVTKVGKNSYQTPEQAEADVKRAFAKNLTPEISPISGRTDKSAPCPLCPQKRTFASALSMSALCH